MTTFQCNYNIGAYLQGLGFVSTSSDYRYMYFTDTPQLDAAIAAIPRWMLIEEIYLWSGT